MHHRLVAGLGIGLVVSASALFALTDAGSAARPAPRRLKPVPPSGLVTTSLELPGAGEEASERVAPGLETAGERHAEDGGALRLEVGAAPRLEVGAALRLEVGASPQVEVGAAPTAETGAVMPAPGPARLWQPGVPDGTRLLGLSDLVCA